MVQGSAQVRTGWRVRGIAREGVGAQEEEGRKRDGAKERASGQGGACEVSQERGY